jgi:hypothetical protein
MKYLFWQLLCVVLTHTSYQGNNVNFRLKTKCLGKYLELIEELKKIYFEEINDSYHSSSDVRVNK